eukprot:779714-Amphidinium_carterae.1
MSAIGVATKHSPNLQVWAIPTKAIAERIRHWWFRTLPFRPIEHTKSGKGEISHALERYCVNHPVRAIPNQDYRRSNESLAGSGPSPSDPSGSS